ncbi:hypothetical protein GCM10011316_27040 [Roseibium aquae]|uniref:histidine kinase n=1 Tax=Roseibium aquae TaxID=1323746 RepID=A0A916TKX6_9HYPH|nr:HAMP domain-containing sensor histidine kinase [Roseibium aquae]GGB53633.1 hypothetical protein GCM10011316_27040 [Roseibium aquae]
MNAATVKVDEPTMHPKRSLSRTFILYTLGSFAILGLVFIAGLTKYLWDRELDRAITTTQSLFQASKEPLERAVWSINEASAQQIVDGLLSLQAVRSVWVETPDTGKYGIPEPDLRDTALKYDLVSPAQYANANYIGSVFFVIDRGEIYNQVTSVVFSTVLSIVLYIFILGVIIRVIFHRLIGLPLSNVVNYLTTPRLIESPPKMELMPGRDDEIGVMASALQTMVQRRHADLLKIQDYQTNLEELVEQRTTQLKTVQEELIQADNLAALGALVAGVSHELNTPLGNGLMSATTISEACAVVQGELDRETLTLEHLREELIRIAEASAVIEKTLGRARELVQNFRQVAVDRQSEKKREFNIDHIITETIATLQPSLRKTPYVVRTELAANTVINSYPGAVSQIVTNLVENAVKHAYENMASGDVVLSSRLCSGGGGVIIECRDHGCGIPEKNLKRLFEPFFTTKFGKGGSGLGMAIVYRLVTEVLQGQISVKSEVGSGTTFSIELPATLANARDAA